MNLIEDASIKEKKLELKGWAFQLETTSENEKIQVFLRNVKEEQEVHWMSISQYDRNDINDYFACDFDYSHSGFTATIKEDKLNFSNDYEIFLKLTYNEEKVDKEGKVSVNKKIKTVSTGTYLQDGKLIDYMPGSFVEPVLTGTYLDTVVKEGSLRFYRREEGVYVYQYEGKLYYIVNQNYFFEEDGTTYVQYHLETTQPENLPEHRLENEWYWDNRGFNFENQEIKDEDTSPYRVAAIELPTEYVISYIWVGYHVEKEWIWQQYFKPDFDLMK